MKHQTKPTISTWTLWSPIKFAAISFGILISTTFIYTLVAGRIYTPSTIPQTPLIIMLIIGFIGTIVIQLKSLPRTKMDRTSFITIHNIQTIILSTLFIISSFIIVRHAQQIMFYLLMLETRLSYTFILTLTGTLLFYLYLLGLLTANIYAKFRRIREFNIPGWKILFSIPFGFAALWAPGYILNSNTAKNATYTTKSTILNHATQWITSRTSHTISTFIAITTLSGFFFGFNSVLLTFSLTLIFGIWALQTGTKAFSKNMHGKYATTVVIFNITLIIITAAFFALSTSATQNAQITTSAPETIEIQQL